MKTLCILLVTSLLLAAGVPRQQFSVVPAAAQLTWTGHAEVGTWAPSGTVQLRRGTVEMAGNVIRQARFEFDMRSIAHANADLQRHLRGADFFDAEQYPTAVFVLRRMAGGVASGDLTIKNVTRPVQIPLQIQWLPTGALQLSGTTSIDRTQFGVTYNSGSFFQNLGDHAIRNDFQLAFVLRAEPVSAAP